MPDPLNSIDPELLKKYFVNVEFPISQEDLMQTVRSHNPPQSVIEQMEQMLRSDSFESYDQLENELAGAYNPGEAQSMDTDLA